MYIISEGGRGIDNIFFSYFQLMQNLENHSKEQVISALKEWASPILIAIVGMLLWRDVTEMRADIKLLLTQQSADRVKIEQLEDDVKLLKELYFTKARTDGTSRQPFQEQPLSERQPAFIQRDDELYLSNKYKNKK